MLLRNIPDYATQIVISEMHNCSALSRIVNPKHNIVELGLNCAPVAHYTIMDNIEVGDFTDSAWNGETWEPDNPFRSGEIRLCQSVPLKKKFSREEATLMCHNWETFQDGYETAVGRALRDLTERYGFPVELNAPNAQFLGSLSQDFNQELRQALANHKAVAPSRS